jgi:hypothetical protein
MKIQVSQLLYYYYYYYYYYYNYYYYYAVGKDLDIFAIGAFSLNHIYSH